MFIMLLISSQYRFLGKESPLAYYWCNSQHQASIVWTSLLGCPSSVQASRWLELCKWPQTIPCGVKEKPNWVLPKLTTQKAWEITNHYSFKLSFGVVHYPATENCSRGQARSCLWAFASAVILPRIAISQNLLAYSSLHWFQLKCRLRWEAFLGCAS